MDNKQTKAQFFRIVIWLIYLTANLLLILTMQPDEYRLFCSACLLIFSAVVTWGTLDKRVSQKVLSYIIMACVMTNNIIDSIVHHNINYVIIVLFGCCTLFSIFKDEILVLVQGIGSLLLILYHVFITKNIDVSIPEEMRIALLSSLGIIGISCYLSQYIRNWKKTEASFKQLADSAMAAEQSKSDFLANMSHEIRTPMNAIVGMCELILREHDISSTVREYCFNIQNSGRSLLSIINDILDFSKIESGKMDLIEEEFNIASTLNDVINMAIARMGDKKLELVVHADPDLPKGLLGDEVRIRQVMINLITNAVKYTQKGVVVLKVSQTRHEYGINLTFSVKDSGIGITEENLEKLFTSFQQVDTKKNRSVEGTGLGLAISKRFVTQMGGFISVSSKYGKGSEFKVVIPLKVADKEPFILIKSATPAVAAGYVDLAKFEDAIIAEEYWKMLSALGGQLHISLSIYKQFDRLKARINRGGVTHCFIAREEYLHDKAYFDNLSSQIEVIVIQDRLNAVPIPLGIKCVYKPFYALPIAAILNNENIIQNLGEAKKNTISFTAPMARVLIVDDNITNLQVAAGLMRPYHMQVTTAGSGIDAIRLLRSKDYDLVFMDHMMPGMDGVETTQKIRQMGDAYFRDIPIIALTANAIGGIKNMFLNSGFQDFMPKPIELSTLDRILKNWLPKGLQKKQSEQEQIHEYKQPEDAAVQNDTALQPQAAMPETCLEGLVDLKTGMHYTGNSMEIYRQILTVYLNGGLEKAAKIKNLYEQKDWKNYVIEVHALKSSSLSIGAKELSELAKEMEYAGKAGNYQAIHEKTEEMLTLYDAVIHAGKRYLGLDNDTIPDSKEPQKTLPEIDKEKLLEFINTIQEAGENFDSEAMTAACDEASKYIWDGKELKPYFDKVKEFIEAFDYEQACETAAAILQQLAIYTGGRKD